MDCFILFLSDRIIDQQKKDTKSLLRKFSFVKKKKWLSSRHGRGGRLDLI